MIPNPIRRVLSSMLRHEVRSLLMGGQACVFYGGAEFSRDTDLALLADADNLERLERALADLQAERIAVPALSLEALERGHAVHFRCRHADVAGMRIDVMSSMRGVDPFETLWDRRTSAELPDGLRLELLSLPDLVAAKKTQRDKDWPMIRRLVEAHHFEHRERATTEAVRFWLRELRTPSLLVETAARWPEAVGDAMRERPLLGNAVAGDLQALETSILEEERLEKAVDREYWAPRRLELERWRRERS